MAKFIAWIVVTLIFSVAAYLIAAFVKLDFFNPLADIWFRLILAFIAVFTGVITINLED